MTLLESFYQSTDNRGRTLIRHTFDQFYGDHDSLSDTVFELKNCTKTTSLYSFLLETARFLHAFKQRKLHNFFDTLHWHGEFWLKLNGNLKQSS